MREGEGPVKKQEKKVLEKELLNRIKSALEGLGYRVVKDLAEVLSGDVDFKGGGLPYHAESCLFSI